MLGFASLTLVLAVNVGIVRPAAAERGPISDSSPPATTDGDDLDPAPIGGPTELIQPCLRLVQSDADTETLPRSGPSWKVESSCDEPVGEPEAMLPTFQFFTDLLVDPAIVIENTRSAVVSLLAPAL